ncbi:MAG: glycosyl hydrolase family 18 protein [Bacillota bacterium]
MTINISGFHLAGSSSGLDTIYRYHHLLDKIIPTWLLVKADGSLIINYNNDKLNDYIKKDKIVPMLQNNRLDSKVSNELIANKKSTDYFVKELIPYLHKEGYGEICIDIEGVNYQKKKEFTEFIEYVTDVFHQAEIRVSTAIPAKSENNQDSTWSGAYDYSSLGEIVDQIIIMAYDFHWPGGPPGPIAPLPWIKDVIDYAIMEIPMGKICFGLGLYAYDWPINSDNHAKGLVYKQVKHLLEKYNSRIEWDQDSETPYFTYNEENIKHEVWLENARSIAKKIEAINDYNLKSAVFWRLGQGDPAIWDLF